MTQTTRRRHRAMATEFEVVLCGDDAEHLAAVADAMFDEVGRIERLLSRYDRASEIARVNRTAAQGPVLIEHELFRILCDCQEWWRRTNGCFDPTATGGQPAGMSAVQLDGSVRTMRFAHPGVRLDLGGYGKGYALDRAGEVARRYGVKSALLHGGTSSVLLIGAAPDGSPWRVGVCDPYSAGSELGQLQLAGCGFSCSAVRDADGAASDVIDPRTGSPLEGQAACGVVAEDAATAEVLSTALLVMGKARAIEYSGRRLPAGVAAGWVDQKDDETRWQWLTERTWPMTLPPRPDGSS